MRRSDGRSRPVVAGVLVLLIALVALPAGTASAALPGLKRVVHSSPSNANSKGVTATCPSGQTLLGGGGIVQRGRRQVILDKAAPQPASSTKAPTSFRVDGRLDDDGFPRNWTLRAYAVCADPIAGLRTYTATSPTDSADKSVTATCPTGRRLVGSGWDIVGAFGEASVEDVVPGNTSVLVTAYEDRNGTPRKWSLRAYAICAKKPAGLARYEAQGTANDEIHHGVTAKCPANRTNLSGGFAIQYTGDILFDSGNILVEALIPRNTAGRDFVVGTSQNDKGYPAPRLLTAYAICAFP